MSKVKANAIDTAEQAFLLSAAPQPLAAASSAFNQIDSFSHQYDRGGNLTVNGKPSYSVDQAATQLLRDGAAYQEGWQRQDRTHLYVPDFGIVQHDEQARDHWVQSVQCATTSPGQARHAILG